MSKRKALDKEAARERRNQLLQAAAAAELSLTDGVRQMRAVTGMTQEEFAQHRGVSARVIKAIERGQGNPTVATLNRIGELFGLEVAFVPKRRPAASTEQQFAVQVSTDAKNRKNPASASGVSFNGISDAADLIEEQRKFSTLPLGTVWDTALRRQNDELTQLLKHTKAFDTLQQQLSRADILSEQLKNVDVLVQRLDKAESLIVELKRAESWTNELRKAESFSKDLQKAEALSAQLKEIQGFNEKLKGIERLSQQLEDLNDWTALRKPPQGPDRNKN